MKRMPTIGKENEKEVSWRDREREKERICESGNQTTA